MVRGWRTLLPRLVYRASLAEPRLALLGAALALLGMGIVGLALLLTAPFAAAAWVVGLALVAAGLWLLRRRRPVPGGPIDDEYRGLGRTPSRLHPAYEQWFEAPDPETARMRREALDALGLGEEASVAAIEAAYRSRIAAAHPDRGGSAGQAARLNRARDVLLGRGTVRR